MMVNNKQLQYFYIIKINKQCLQSIFIFDVWISCCKLFLCLSLALIDVRITRAEATSIVIDITAVAFEIETREELNRVKHHIRNKFNLFLLRCKGHAYCPGQRRSGRHSSLTPWTSRRCRAGTPGVAPAWRFPFELTMNKTISPRLDLLRKRSSHTNTPTVPSLYLVIRLEL